MSKIYVKIKSLLILLPILLFIIEAEGQNLQPIKIRVNNFEFNYIERGQGDPIILLHGGMGDYRSWEAQMEVLARRYHVISYSRRYSYPNQNKITKPLNYSPFIDDAEDLAAFLGQLKLKRVNLVGISAGAFTALEFTLKHPETVRTLVLAEPPVLQLIRYLPDGEKVYQSFINTVWKPVGDVFAKNEDRRAMGIFYYAMSGHKLDSLPPDVIDVVMQGATAMKAQALSFEPFPEISKDKLRRLKTSTLVITGEDTNEINKLVNRELTRLLPNVEQITIPKAGHASARQNPAAFNEAVLEFVKNRRPNKS